MDSSNAAQRSCSASMNINEPSMGVSLSASRAQAASSYGLIVGQSSVSASLKRIKELAWLSAR